jgi:hypothetical protein
MAPMERYQHSNSDQYYEAPTNPVKPAELGSAPPRLTGHNNAGMPRD